MNETQNKQSLNESNTNITTTNRTSAIEDDRPKPSLNETIRIYLRLRPCRNGSYLHDHIQINDSSDKIDIRVPIKEQGYINNTIQKHTFKFDHVFDSKTNQDQIFNDVAKEVIDSTIDGYNGTIFAYGQTGSGKTYTITGGVESIELRGIIPRALSYIFEETRKRTLYQWKIYISYLEIYNNDGYDLLYENTSNNNDPSRRIELDSLPRVRIRENANKQLILTNLSIHEIDNFQEGMALLMLGDDNRVVAETPKNDASTRSHCLFMIQIESQKIGEDKRTLSKLHIVDLSGSERPFQTGVTGQRLNEALNINMSLFYLEQVITEINRHSMYISYRNSMMTMCLRDSIGGNCKTRMIANLSCDFDDVFESLSTCRFAQRVALIKNTAVVNEVVDPSVLIQKQKSEIEELKAELEMLKGKNQKSFLEKSDLEECNKIVKEFLEDETFKVKIELNDKLMIQECFNIIKIKYKDMEKKLKANSGEIVLNGTQDLDKIINLENENKRLQAEIDRLKELLSNREEEMKVLIKNIDNKKNEGNKTLLQKIQQEENEALNKIKNNILGNFVKFDNLTSANNSKINESNFLEDNNISSIVNQTQKSTVKTQFVPPNLIKEINLANSYIKNPNSSEINFELLKNRNNAYLFFKNNYYLKEVEIQNKEKIQEKFKFGKEISVEYSKLSSQIQTLKKKIEDIRKIRILDESKKNDENLNKEEDDLMKKFMSMKANEKIQKEELKKLHSEIKTMQTVDSQFDIKRIKHFEFWSETMIKKIEFENKNGKIDFSNLNSSILTNNNFISNNLNESTISQASELNEKLTKKLEQLK
jgi:kinesin family protein 6/9